MFSGYIKIIIATSILCLTIYIIIITFLIFFGIFALLAYPHSNFLHPSAEWIAKAHKKYPHLGGFINVIGYWTYSIFYVLAEIWGSIEVGELSRPKFS